MAALNYKTPGVYAERTKGQVVIRTGTTGIAGFAGICRRGDAEEPFFCTSWTDAAEKMAGGLATPFMQDSYLAFAVYDFFLNGGKGVYISRAHTNAIKKATCIVNGGENNQIIFEAKDEGSWGNTLKIWVTKNEVLEDTFDVHIKQGNNVERVYSQLTNIVGDSKYFIDYLSMFSNEVNVLAGNLVVFSEQTFSGGNDGEDGISDADFTTALNKFDSIEDITLVAVPGQTSLGSITDLCAFLNNHEYVFGAIDAPMAYKTQQLRELRKRISCERGVLLNTWQYINDPLSNVADKLRAIPCSGGYLGNVAAKQNKPWQSPAGTSCKMQGAVDLVFNAQKVDTDILNPLGIVCILSKKNRGICIWGVRSLSNDPDYLYVTSILMDIYIRKNTEESCIDLVFDPNKEGLDSLWGRIRNAVTGFLDGIRVQGGFATEDAGSAYFVKCDAELNPKSITDQGYCLVQVGYAPVTPGEFIVFTFQNRITTTS